MISMKHEQLHHRAAQEQDKGDRQKQMPVFVFFILLTSTNACPMVAMCDDEGEDDDGSHQYMRKDGSHQYQ